MKIIETERLLLRRLTTEDAVFIMELVNEPSWIRFIGDRNVKSRTDARDYLLKGPIAMYGRHGFGLYMVELKSEGVPIGICGLVKRDSLEDVDIGFAFLPRYWGRGYGLESASAVMEYARKVVGLKRLVAITSPDNEDSIRLLERIGMRFERTLQPREDGRETKLFALELG